MQFYNLLLLLYYFPISSHYSSLLPLMFSFIYLLSIGKLLLRLHQPPLQSQQQPNPYYPLFVACHMRFVWTYIVHLHQLSTFCVRDYLRRKWCEWFGVGSTIQIDRVYVKSKPFQGFVWRNDKNPFFDSESTTALTYTQQKSSWSKTHIAKDVKLLFYAGNLYRGYRRR